MTAAEFNLLVRNFPQIDPSMAEDLEAQVLKNEYCQTLYVLLARIKQDEQDPQTSTYIQRAALHAPDRGHLKKLLGQKNTLIQTNPEASPAQSKDPEETAADLSQNITEPQQSFSDQSDVTERNVEGSIADEVQTDVRILKEKTKQFSELSPVPKKSLDRFLAQQETPILEEKPEKVITVTKGSKTQDETDLLLNEIKSNRKKVKAENPKQSEQISIIDQFIRTNLVTIKPPEKGTRRQDLTESANSYSENVISETLVDILIRQGKNEKAIEVLRKLIWKFPQKKHLFATRIQELSK